MTIEQLTGLDIDQLEKFTDDELTEICRPYFTITRPELQDTRKGAKSSDPMGAMMAEAASRHKGRPKKEHKPVQTLSNKERIVAQLLAQGKFAEAQAMMKR